MRAPKHDLNDLVGAEISLLPLIDVCLVLMIILLVVVPMVRVGTAEALPETAKGGQPASPQPGSPNPNILSLDDPQLKVTIHADGRLVVDGRFVEANDLQKTLGEIWAVSPDRPVIIEGDRRLRYAQVRWVLQSVNAAGFRRAGVTPARAVH
jgi:biopolymer transport protein ExbD